jgi:pimeloyl-ACP methyl ester carboxylesterase
VYVTSDGVQIHYQAEGDGEPLVLHHGFTSNLSAWRQIGYVRALQAGRRLILIDARGHGGSDKPHEAGAYTTTSYVRDVISILDAERISEADYFGYSLGAWVGFGLLKDHPERFRSVILGGAHPFPDNSWVAFEGVDGTDRQSFLEALETVVGESIRPEAKPLLFSNDLIALAAAARQRPDLTAVLATIRIPTMFFAGDADARYSLIRDAASRVEAAEFVSLPGLNHISTFVRSDLVLPHVMKFLSERP